MKLMKLLDLTAGLEKLFTSRHMAEKTLSDYQRGWKRLGEFLIDTYGDDNFDFERGMAYFEKRFGLHPNEQPGPLTEPQKGVFRIVNTLQEYQLTGSVSHLHFTRSKPPVLIEKFAVFLAGYEANALSAGMSKFTVRSLRRRCKYFLLHLQHIGMENLSKLDMPVLDSFMKTWASFSSNTVKDNLKALKHLLRYLHSQKIIEVVLANNLHVPKIQPGPLIPSGWTDEELQRLLDSIDLNNPIGKRDYAMILLAAVMGIRAGDIAALRFSNLHLRAKRISFIQHKTKKPLDLPIPKEVGWPLIDYIKNGRPKLSESDVVFVRHKAPFEAFSDAASLSGMLERRRQKAGLEKGNMHRGFHSLRHAAANGYLEMGTPLPVITEILGHANIETTSIYLKRDLKKLAECVLDPKELTDDEA